MRNPVVLCSALLATVAVVSLATAGNTYYVSPTGSSSAGCTKGDPCSLSAANDSATAGDTVVLMDGTYKEQLKVKGSGTSSSAWLTFQADDCATPIIEGDGVEQNTGDSTIDQPTGVGSKTSTYVRFIGIVARGWNSGFGNGWTGDKTTNSNGNWEFKYCIADGNGRTGFTFFSAAGIHMQNCISSHNGMSANHSWSSGFTLYEAQGNSNVIEGSISFENMDNQKHTDGSGFIADESSNNASFFNNLAFRNGGSCFRMTRVTGTKFINNTCYHNAMDSADNGPPDPGELYFTNDGTINTTSGISFINNVLVATGTGPGAKVIGSSGYAQPTAGWTSNITATGTVSNYFTGSDGNNPDFSPGSSLAGKGSSGSGVPSSDIGFDPQCITKGNVSMLGTFQKGSWWQYSVDLNYIKSIGGVQKCFNPKARSGNDVGAYASGAITKANACATGGSGPTGGASSTGGSQATTGGNGNATGGTGAVTTGTKTATGGSGPVTTGGSKATTGGAPTTGAGGTKATGGAGNPVGGTTQKASSNTGGIIATAGSSSGGSNTGGSIATSQVGGSSSVPSSSNPVGNTGGSANIGGAVSNIGGATAPANTANNTNTSVTNNSGNSGTQGGCGCRVAGQSSRSTVLTGAALLGLAMLRSMRRRKAR